MNRVPRVRCLGCAFQWFGPTAAHGLRVIGSCPRCAGELDFLLSEPESDAVALPGWLQGITPAAVLGRPTGWQPH